MININTNNNNRDLNKLDIAIAGASGLTGALGACSTMGIIGKVYSNKVLQNQPVMFSEEPEHFNALQEYAEKVAKIYDSNPDLAEILNKLKKSGKEKQDLINSAYVIYNSNEAKEARTYSNEFLNLGKIAHTKAISDEELISHSKNLLEKIELNKKEKDLLTNLLKDPGNRKNILPLEKVNFLKIYKSLSILSQNVIISPKLLALAYQMSDEHNLKSKGVSYLFGTPEKYEQFKKQAISNIKTKEQEELKTLDDSSRGNIIKKIKAFTIKFKSKRAISKITKTYDHLINGTNAFYSSETKIAKVPMLSCKREAIFHELGHSINYTKSKNISKMLMLLKHKFPVWGFTSVLLSSVFIKKQKMNKEEKRPITKVREFVKNNIMSFAIAISAPNLFEEGLASMRAIKFLKGKVTQQQLKNIKIKSFTSWGSYVINALTIALTFKFATFLSDKIQSAKLNSANNQA